MDLQDKGVMDSGCLRYMTGNMSYLIDNKEIDVGYVSFGGNPKRGKITRKCTIKTAFKVFNIRTRIVEKNLHIRSNENKPNVVGTQANDNAGQANPKSSHDDGFKPSNNDGKKVDEDLSKGNECYDQEKEDNVNNTNNVNTVTSIVNAAGTNKDNELPFDLNMPALEYVGTFNFLNKDENDDAVYVCQPPGFEDPGFLDRVYKVKKALYGLHQAPRAWYETLSIYLLDNGFQRGKIDKTLFIKRHKGDILLVQVYVDDIIFDSTKKELCDAFERYLKVQPKIGLWYLKDSPFDLVAYTDSDYARASMDMKSTTGGGEEVFVEQEVVVDKEKIDEVTLAQALVELKTSKPKVKGVVIQEPSKSPTTTTTIPKKSHDKDKEEVAIDAIPLVVKSPKIVDWKIYKEGKKSDYQIIRADEKSNMYMFFSQMLTSFDWEDLYKLVKAKYGSTRPAEDLDLLLWGDLKTMFEPHVEDAVWRKQQGYKVLEWKLYESCKVHSLRMQSMQVFMLVEKTYPLTPYALTMMLEKKLQSDYYSEMAYQLLKLITKQLKKGGLLGLKAFLMLLELLLLKVFGNAAAQMKVTTTSTKKLIRLKLKLVMLKNFKEKYQVFKTVSTASTKLPLLGKVKIVMDNPNSPNEPNKDIPEENLVIPESNHVEDAHDPNEMVDIPDDEDLVDYDGDDEEPEEELEEEPKEEPEEEPEQQIRHGNQFAQHPNLQPGNMNGWLEEDDDVNENVNNKDIEDEDVKVEVDDEAELIFFL
nr:putative ribonuclease H-like domain-containing protein [Tanacetum cinerariifolium]